MPRFPEDDLNSNNNNNKYPAISHAISLRVSKIDNPESS